MFEEKLIEEIIQVWEFDQNHPDRKRNKKPIPEKEEIKEIIEQSFLASLKREEDKSISFSLVYLNKENIEEEIRTTSYKQLILTFDKKLLFNAENIAKIGPAFDLKMSSLIIGKDNIGKNEFYIWGAMFFGPSLNRFTEIPVVKEEYNLFRPDVFMITAKHPGSLLISRGKNQIGNFVSGQFSKATPQPHAIAGLGNQLLQNIRSSDGFKMFEFKYWAIYRDALDYLLTESADRGHGATILIVPDKMKKIVETNISIKHSFPESIQIEDLIHEIANLNADPIGTIHYNTKIKERLELLAQLSTVDGALVLNQNLDVLSFGSILQATSKWEGQVIVGADGFGGGGEDFKFTRLGTRHNSTIDFIGAFPGCVGFVISQDGPIRAFISQKENVVSCWPDCRASMFI